ncbi:kinase-like domain-containing protein [Phellopilus nigrolimitatus]|nr:kinase-like domain-containing protein [Phellopilus nigrolimitatus]
MAPQKYVPAGCSVGGKAHAPAAAQAPLESSTIIRTQKPRSSSRVLGDYTLGKTLRRGQVKLAYHNLTGEKLMIKTLPRTSIARTGMNGVVPTAEEAAKQVSKEASKETRAMREARCRCYYTTRISGLCGFSSHTRTTTTWHKSTSSAVFASAWPASSPTESAPHSTTVTATMSSTVTSKSRTRNIKIIGFSLSNLYSSAARLSTFRRPLYFASLELLNARVYTGPEVDVWSFGVVLYVLVCGKVSFDNMSMPAIHAKIERGLVEYPDWLGAECKHLLTRMLVVNPSAHATVAEILSHALDRQVIRGMTGFEFGSEDEIERKLVDVLKSDAYARAVQAWERRRQAPGPRAHRPRRAFQCIPRVS